MAKLFFAVAMCLFAGGLDMTVGQIMGLTNSYRSRISKRTINRSNRRWVFSNRMATNFDNWEPYLRLTNAPGHSWLSSGGERCLAVCGDTLHATWYDDRNGNDDIYYKRSTDGGLTWGPDRQITAESAYQAMPTIAVSGSTVHLFWVDERNHPGRTREADIYYRRSTDNGTTWQSETLLCTDPNGEYGGWHPCAAVCGDTVHLVWEDDRNGDDLIYYKRSIDAGRTWTQDRAIARDMGAWLATIAVWGRNLHVVWENFNALRVNYRSSTDGGNNWGTQVTFPSEAVSYAPCVDVSHDTVHVVYSDGSETNFDQLYYRRSIDNGRTWEPETMLTRDNDFTWSADVAVSGSNVHVVRLLMDFYHIWYHRSTDGGLTWEPGFEISSYLPMQCMGHAVAVYDSTVHVLFDGMIPESTGFYEIYYRRNRGGNPVAIREIPARLVTNRKGQVIIVPNPVVAGFAKIWFVGIDSSLQFETAEIYDVNGRAIVQIRLQPGGKEVLPLDLQSLARGLYLIRFSDGSYTTTQKLIVQGQKVNKKEK